MRAAEPAFNVELRQDRQGQAFVVFSFPYLAEIVDAVRAIPGRRFDWEAREWWAPRADATAPFVKGVLERFPSLHVHPDVDAWLARAVAGWVGRVTAGRRDGGALFALNRGPGEPEAPLAAGAAARGGRLGLPFSKEAAAALREPKGAPLADGPLRCAPRLQVHQAPA